MRVNRLKHYLKLDEVQLANTLAHELRQLNYNVIETDDYVYGMPLDNNTDVLLVAHLDIAHKNPPYVVFHDKEYNVMWSPTGLGADDRAGCFAIMEIIKYNRAAVLFTYGEESGGTGARQFVKEMPVNLNYKMLIQLDRCGKDDCVFYDNNSKPFQEYIESFGFETDHGTFSDISIIAPRWKVNAVNLSVGYYKEHYNEEHLAVNQLISTIRKVNILLSMPIPDFKYEEVTYLDYYRGGDRFAGEIDLYHCSYCAVFSRELHRVDGWSLCPECVEIMTFHCIDCSKLCIDDGVYKDRCFVCDDKYYDEEGQEDIDTLIETYERKEVI